jgi:hypothetical protein
MRFVSLLTAVLATDFELFGLGANEEEAYENYGAIINEENWE